MSTYIIRIVKVEYIHLCYMFLVFIYVFCWVVFVGWRQSWVPNLVQAGPAYVCPNCHAVSNQSTSFLRSQSQDQPTGGNT